MTNVDQSAEKLVDELIANEMTMEEILAWSGWGYGKVRQVLARAQIVAAEAGLAIPRPVVVDGYIYRVVDELDCPSDPVTAREAEVVAVKDYRTRIVTSLRRLEVLQGHHKRSTRAGKLIERLINHETVARDICDQLLGDLVGSSNGHGPAVSA